MIDYGLVMDLLLLVLESLTLSAAVAWLVVTVAEHCGWLGSYKPESKKPSEGGGPPEG